MPRVENDKMAFLLINIVMNKPMTSKVLRVCNHQLQSPVLEPRKNKLISATSIPPVTGTNQWK